ncbi:MAG: trypsin-like peptidase domain-containing protein [Candidatus Sumerlaeota bacterium]|nr:trypsin-like peptidase domain-containing protein [Candidatus Sumerlaeota bacterium]
MRALSGFLASAVVFAAAFAARAGEIDLSKVNDETPLTVGLFSQIAQQTLQSIVCIRIHPKFSQEDLDKIKKFKDFKDNPADHLDDPDFRRFMERYYDPDLRDLHDFFDNPESLTASAGAGVIFDAEGHIVTNSHVIGSDDSRGDLEVALYDGRTFHGKDVEVVAVSALADLAVLKIAADNLKPARFGDSKATKIGEPVLAIGHPLEFENTVSEGIISAAHRRIEKAIIEDYFQTTAMINPGNSGGALVNMRGEVIGINIAIATNTQRWQGIGFAAPAHIVSEVVGNLIRSGREGFGWVGVQMVPSEPRDERLRYLRWFGLDKGVIVDYVFPGNPADAAGLRQFDIITAIDGKPIDSNAQFVEAVARRPVNDIVKLDVRRPGEEGKLDSLTINVTVGDRPSKSELDAQTEANRKRTDLIGPATAPDASKLKDNPLGIEVSEGDKGLTITQVLPRSAAERVDLRTGDALLEVNGLPTRTRKDLDKALGEVGKRAEHLIRFDRGGFVFFKLAPVPAAE